MNYIAFQFLISGKTTVPTLIILTFSKYEKYFLYITSAVPQVGIPLIRSADQRTMKTPAD